MSGSFNLADQTELFKINYYKKSENMYNSENVLQGRIKKKYDFTGKQKLVATPLSFSGGVGSGTLPKANAGQYGNAIITSKKVYARAEIEREAIKASANDAGAFVQATKETVQKTVESYMRNCSRILFGDGSGILGRGDGATTVVAIAGGYRVAMDLAGFTPFNDASFEEKDFVQVVSTMNAGNNRAGTAEATLLEISAVDVALGTVDLLGFSVVLAALAGVGPLPTTSGIVMQGSYLNDPVGLKAVIELGDTDGAGNIYGIPFQRRWSALVVDAGLKGVTTDLMNRVMLQIEKRAGKVPKMIMTSYEQQQNILALLEDQKVYNLPNRNVKGALSFSGVEFMSTRGPVGIFVDRFCPKDQIFFLNDERIECHHRPGFGWFDDDGTVFLRLSNDDSYEARYGGYYENFIIPTGHGLLKNLAI